MTNEELRRKKLRRNAKSLYTLGSKEWDEKFGINNVLTLTPDPYDIVNLAALVYLYGIFRIHVDTFTATAKGYLVSFVKESPVGQTGPNRDFYGTFIINSNLQYIIEDLIKLALSNFCTGGQPTINDIEPPANALYYEIWQSLKNPGLSLLEKCLIINRDIRRKDLLPIYTSVGAAYRSFVAANGTNCDDNHEIYDYSFDPESKKPKSKNFNNILHKYILPGYRLYIGRDKKGYQIPKQGQILNNVTRMIVLYSMLGYGGLDITCPVMTKEAMQDMINVSNMASTDYSADVAQAVLEQIIVSYEFDDVSKECEAILTPLIPPAPNNDEQVTEIRGLFHRK